MWMWVWHTWMSMYCMYAQNPQRPSGGVGTPKIGVADDHKLNCWLESKLEPLKEQMLLMTDSSL